MWYNYYFDDEFFYAREYDIFKTEWGEIIAGAQYLRCRQCSSLTTFTSFPDNVPVCSIECLKESK